MMDFYVEYSAEGRILAFGTMQGGSRFMARPFLGGQLAFFEITDDKSYQGVSFETHYLDLGSMDLRERPVVSEDQLRSIPADGLTEVAIPVHPGTKVQTRGDEWLVPEGDDTFEFSSDEPGTWRFEIHPPFPARSYVYEVTVHEV